ncbi:HK97 gp10 family phage protein [Microbispora sp. RL4-1S]|uniref:HK97 gp10 family phage protein n=1 Tax=Microbispora oryzae TaxID=2806554 RepID=A0A940WF93_9ACTN|nr:HK97 gp10 family phage protein [Microbispora oryzae]MBP2704401.1 HK97 gp10 family phage protein [Microbispora oryzae]
MDASWDASEVNDLIKVLVAAGPKADALCSVVVRKTGFDTVAGGQDRVAVDTGHLKSTIGVDFDDDGLGFEAGPTASYGAHSEYGTKPHVIRPRNAKALHWVNEHGDDVFARVVHHPGTSPQPYMRPSFDAAIEPLPEILAQVGQKALDG